MSLLKASLSLHRPKVMLSPHLGISRSYLLPLQAYACLAESISRSWLKTLLAALC